MNTKPYNPLVGTTFIRRLFSKLFSEKFTEEERRRVESDVLGDRSIESVLESLSPQSPISDYLLLLVALRGKVNPAINISWAPADFMVMRHITENLDQSTMNDEWAEAKRAFIESCGDRVPSAEELADYDNPEPKFISEPDWLREIPLSKT